jgi:hypothetical protein
VGIVFDAGSRSVADRSSASTSVKKSHGKFLIDAGAGERLADYKRRIPSAAVT